MAAIRHSFRDIYPDYTRALATGELTVPEQGEQQAYGEVRSEAGGMRAYTQADVWRYLGWAAVLVLLLLLWGWLT